MRKTGEDEQSVEIAGSKARKAWSPPRIVLAVMHSTALCSTSPPYAAEEKNVYTPGTTFIHS